MTIGQAILLGAFCRDRGVHFTISQYHLFNRLSVKHNKYIYKHKRADIDTANKADKDYCERMKGEWW